MLVPAKGDEALPRQRMKRVSNRDILRQNSGSMSPLPIAVGRGQRQCIHSSSPQS